MKQKCPNCGFTYELEADGFHFCPKCVCKKMKYSYGITPKHTSSGAASYGEGTSYISDQVNGEQIFNYLTGGKYTNPTGAEFVRSARYNSVNAICYKPLGEIPGSGIAPGGDHAAEFAVLFDIEGKSDTGPHFAFYTSKEISTRLSSADWVRLPMCSKCKQITVTNVGDICLNCRALISGTAMP